MPCDRERRARHATCQQVNTAERSTIDLTNIGLANRPLVAVTDQRLARIWLDFDSQLMGKAGCLKS